MRDGAEYEECKRERERKRRKERAREIQEGSMGKFATFRQNLI